jgi:hypothetical protein
MLFSNFWRVDKKLIELGLAIFSLLFNKWRNFVQSGHTAGIEACDRLYLFLKQTCFRLISKEIYHTKNMFAEMCLTFGRWQFLTVVLVISDSFNGCLNRKRHLGVHFFVEPRLSRTMASITTNSEKIIEPKNLFYLRARTTTRTVSH